MLKKKYFTSCLSLFALILFCGNKCNNNYIEQEQENYYTENIYKLPDYTGEENKDFFYRQFKYSLPQYMSGLREKIEKCNPKWKTSGTEKDPYILWQDYRAAHFLADVFTQSETFNHYLDSWGHLIEAPTEANEQKLKIAYQLFQADEKSQDLLAIAYQQDSNPIHHRLTQADLAYQEWYYFMLQNDLNHTGCMLHGNIKRLSASLAEWQKEQRPTGRKLWDAFQDQFRDRLTVSKIFQYEKNKVAIKESLAIADRLAANPYNLNYQELLEKLPHGIKQLHSILQELSLEEAEDIKLLNNYLKIFKHLYNNNIVASIS